MFFRLGVAVKTATHFYLLFITFCCSVFTELDLVLFDENSNPLIKKRIQYENSTYFRV